RLTELYHAYEEFNDEITVLDPNEAHQIEFINIQERFYTLEDILNPAGTSIAGTDASSADIGTSSNATRIKNADVTPNRKRRIKLPEATLPTFNGKYENWLSFKNAFDNMIGSQTDLSDIDKLYYLRAALTGDAASKIRIFATDGINYTRATTEGLSKLADDMQQHVASLSSLGVSVGPEMIVHILESKLPKTALDRWEANLERDEVPKPDQIYEFIYKAAVCASRHEKAKTTEAERGKDEPPVKRKRTFPANRALVLNASRNCLMCKNKQHPLFMCDTFKRLPVTKRIEAVKNAKICYNCLRSHRGIPCRLSGCTICQKRHNTLLHLDNYATAGKSSQAAKPESTQTE
ncbi:PREDICTED: uncharacterized protein LOC105461164, partial [Wasmannia auropunctata]|uniref:uncharacterized protein LOC105461164 n=1 Tax=Wasmannia auropunctata TaxID=64793 RepID=UPI0005F099B4